MDSPVLFWIGFFLTAGLSNAVVYTVLWFWTRWQADCFVACWLKLYPQYWLALAGQDDSLSQDVL